MPVKIEDIMIKDVLTVDVSDNVLNATIKMNEREVGCVVAVDEGKPIGVLTERDILRRIVVEKRDAEKTKVKEIMSTPLISGSPEMKLEDAIKTIILKRVKKLPILSNEKLVGIITLFDIIRLSPITTNLLRKTYETQEVPPNIEKYVIQLEEKRSDFQKLTKGKEIPIK
ncbi:MAG: cyclic nucleotide-binding/CBS domain-containing protein [Candidatus Lokiarchaeia archaeon]